MPFLSTRIIVGHAHTPKRFQISKLLSCTTANFMPSRFVASLTLSLDFSQRNSGVVNADNRQTRSFHTLSCQLPQLRDDIATINSAISPKLDHHHPAFKKFDGQRLAVDPEATAMSGGRSAPTLARDVCRPTVRARNPSPQKHIERKSLRFIGVTRRVPKGTRCPC